MFTSALTSGQHFWIGDNIYMFAKIDKIKIRLIAALVTINLIIVFGAIANGIVKEPLIDVHDKQSQFLGAIANEHIDQSGIENAGIFKLAFEQYEQRNDLVDGILTFWQVIAGALGAITLLQAFLVYGFVRNKPVTA